MPLASLPLDPKLAWIDAGRAELDKEGKSWRELLDRAERNDVGVVLNAKGQSMNLRPQFCKQGSGNWQLQKKH